MKTNLKVKKFQFIVNVVGADDFLTEKLNIYFRNEEVIRLLFSSLPLNEAKVDCLIFPFEHYYTWREKALLELYNVFASNIPILCWGNSNLLKEAFQAGCADYLREPWEPVELEMRLKRILAKENYFVKSLMPNRIAFQANNLRVGAKNIKLTMNEMRILRLLLKARQQLVRREVFFYAIWGQMPKIKSRVVDVHISSLRKKLSASLPWTIEKVRNEGYLLNLNQDKE